MKGYQLTGCTEFSYFYTQRYSVLRGVGGSAFLLRYRRHSGGSYKNILVTTYRVEVGCLGIGLISIMQNISWVGLGCTINPYSGSHNPPTITGRLLLLYRKTLPTGARKEWDVSSYYCGCAVTYCLSVWNGLQWRAMQFKMRGYSANFSVQKKKDNSLTRSGDIKIFIRHQFQAVGIGSINWYITNFNIACYISILVH
jgi:hypothetical protein